MSNDILISVFHNAKEYLIPFQKNKTIYELINVIINKFNINISLYDLVYDNKSVPFSKKLLIKNLIGDKENPPFLLREKASNKQNQKKEICVLIEFFPSFRDLSEQIDYFNSHYCNYRPENYDIEYRNNYCCVYFYNKETAFAFTEYINTLRLSNDLYHKVKMKLCYPSQISKNRSIIVKKVNPISLIKKNVSSKANNKSFINQ